PKDLLLAQERRGIGAVVEHDEVYALVIERVVQWSADHLAIGLAAVERRVVLARKEIYLWYFQFGGLLAEFDEPLPAYPGVIGGLSGGAGEHDKVRFFLQ